MKKKLSLRNLKTEQVKTEQDAAYSHPYKPLQEETAATAENPQIFGFQAVGYYAHQQLESSINPKKARKVEEIINQEALLHWRHLNTKEPAKLEEIATKVIAALEKNQIIYTKEGKREGEFYPSVKIDALKGAGRNVIKEALEQELGISSPSQGLQEAVREYEAQRRASTETDGSVTAEKLDGISSKAGLQERRDSFGSHFSVSSSNDDGESSIRHYGASFSSSGSSEVHDLAIYGGGKQRGEIAVSMEAIYQRAGRLLEKVSHGTYTEAYLQEQRRNNTQSLEQRPASFAERIQTGRERSKSLELTKPASFEEAVQTGRARSNSLQIGS